MPTYVGPYTWTDQGIRNVKDTVKRVEEARAAFEKGGARVIAIYWTQGRYDLVSIAEFPDEETASAGALALGMAGNVHTETLRAFSADDMQRILQKLPLTLSAPGEQKKIEAEPGVTAGAPGCHPGLLATRSARVALFPGGHGQPLHPLSSRAA